MLMEFLFESEIGKYTYFTYNLHLLYFKVSLKISESKYYYYYALYTYKCKFRIMEYTYDCSYFRSLCDGSLEFV